MNAIDLFESSAFVTDGVIIATGDSDPDCVTQASIDSSRFAQKWASLQEGKDSTWHEFAKQWYLDLYGWKSEDRFQEFLTTRSVVLDAGCGDGTKSAWFANLSPDTLVIAMDQSQSVFAAAEVYSEIDNLAFARGNIAETALIGGAVDFVNCDQVLHHTPVPPATLAEFARISTDDATLSTYVYAQKALPREIVDSYFRAPGDSWTDERIWKLSEELAVFGRALDELELEVDFPSVPELGIEGGRQSLQRFIYWNFLKCFWNEDMSHDANVAINFDWYAPAIAFRYSADEFVSMLASAGWCAEFMRSEPACHTGRFSKCSKLTD